jgi:hypothetical protein
MDNATFEGTAEATELFKKQAVAINQINQNHSSFLKCEYRKK